MQDYLYRMKLTPLTAISPIDGRYHRKTEQLSDYFSEFALIRYRVTVEVEYFIALAEAGIPQLKSFERNHADSLRLLCRNFSIEDASRIKELEQTTNHDVKAVEYFLRERFESLGLRHLQEFIHFGLTSQDINNTAIPMSNRDCLQHYYLPELEKVTAALVKKSMEWKDIPMLARTHGQPASPTMLGKEIYVFAERLSAQRTMLTSIPSSAKFGGATGNLNAHYAAYPGIDWKQFANDFVGKKLGLHRSLHTTQIEHYDHLAAMFDTLKRINTILMDLSRDIWMYISMDYFKQKIKTGEIGSSAMPHKVNPIDFENAEGNLGVANALFEHFSAKLPISRLQRDLTDSTVLRNIGVPMAHTTIAMQSLLNGLDKLILHETALHADLENNWAVVAEAIQTILRRENYPDPYGALKELTRTNKKITETEIQQFINGLPVHEALKKELRGITPFNYTGKFIP